jgi:hypothetical protein
MIFRSSAVHKITNELFTNIEGSIVPTLTLRHNFDVGVLSKLIGVLFLYKLINESNIQPKKYLTFEELCSILNHSTLFLEYNTFMTKPYNFIGTYKKLKGKFIYDTIVKNEFTNFFDIINLLLIIVWYNLTPYKEKLIQYYAGLLEVLNNGIKEIQGLTREFKNSKYWTDRFKQSTNGKFIPIECNEVLLRLTQELKVDEVIDDLKFDEVIDDLKVDEVIDDLKSFNKIILEHFNEKIYLFSYAESSLDLVHDNTNELQSDCGETTIRNIIHVLFPNKNKYEDLLKISDILKELLNNSDNVQELLEDSDIFKELHKNISKLDNKDKDTCKEFIEHLLAFYKKYPTVDSQLEKDIDSRLDWLNTLKNIPDIEYELNIEYPLNSGEENSYYISTDISEYLESNLLKAIRIMFGINLEDLVKLINKIFKLNITYNKTKFNISHGKIVLRNTKHGIFTLSMSNRHYELRKGDTTIDMIGGSDHIIKMSDYEKNILRILKFNFINITYDDSTFIIDNYLYLPWNKIVIKKLLGDDTWKDIFNKAEIIKDLENFIRD